MEASRLGTSSRRRGGSPSATSPAAFIVLIVFCSFILAVLRCFLFLSIYFYVFVLSRDELKALVQLSLFVFVSYSSFFLARRLVLPRGMPRLFASVCFALCCSSTTPISTLTS